MRGSEGKDLAQPTQLDWTVIKNSNPSDSKDQLESELADAKLLHKLSIELIQEDGIAGTSYIGLQRFHFPT